MSESFEFQSVGRLSSPFKQKFGTPRQPGLAPAAVSRLHLDPSWGAAADGLEAFSHVWLVFVFHLHLGRGGGTSARPPRLGGQKKMGVFATRAPYRPNPIGLSVARLLAVERTPEGVVLVLSGADLVDETPILDIKPYVPYADAVAEASSGWAGGALPSLEVGFTEAARADLAAQPDAQALESLIIQTLRLDPRPAHLRGGPSRKDHRMRLSAVDVQWRVTATGEVEVTRVWPG